jgi:hypothetical protein
VEAHQQTIRVRTTLALHNMIGEALALPGIDFVQHQRDELVVRRTGR